ncbi:Rhamnogalacturonan exolyase YesX [compost metagenome]
MYTAQGEKISDRIPSSNFAIWWDGDLSRELLDHDWQGDPLRVGIPKIDKWDYENNQLIEIERFEGTYSNNDTKGNPVLQADLLGDWREEVIFRTEDSSALRLYTTTDVTEHRIYTLMHDPIYRLGVAWQNTGYNQPPHTGFFLGTGMETPEQPHIYTLSHNDPIIGAPEQPVDPSSSAGAGASSGQRPAVVVGNGTIKQTAVVNANGKAQADIAAADFTKAAESSASHEVRIDAATNQAAKSVYVSLPAQAVKKAAEQLIDRVVIRLGSATITLDKEWIRSNLSESALKIELSITEVDAASLSAEVREKLGGRQAYDITLMIDGKNPASFAGGVKAELDYIPKAGERANGIVVYYLDDNGGLQIVKNGVYEPSTGKAVFKPEHFSKYAVAYVNISFHDIGHIGWAVDSIESLAARGIVDGVGNDAFKPNQTVTRAQFLKMLMYAFDLADANAESTLSDVKEGSWYYSSVAAAERLGIVQGKADGSFGVNDEITRQDMAVMAYRAAQQLQIKLQGTGEAVDFTDKSAIGSYALEAVEAMQSGGVIQGIGEGRFAPQGHATRAQAAVIIDKLLRL